MVQVSPPQRGLGRSLHSVDEDGRDLVGAELQGVAMSLAGLGDGEAGLRLAGSVEAEKLRLGMESTMGFWEELLERYLGAARETVGPEAARRALDIGRAIPFDEAVALALGEREMELPTVRAGSPKT